MQQVVERFNVAGDDGITHTVIAIQEFIEVRAVGQHEWIKGMKRLELDDGSPINYIDANTFKIVFTDQIVRKVS
jgi:hypothetical protein